jgi:hypothetical protein
MSVGVTTDQKQYFKDSQKENPDPHLFIPSFIWSTEDLIN